MSFSKNNVILITICHLSKIKKNYENLHICSSVDLFIYIFLRMHSRMGVLVSLTNLKCGLH